MTQRHITPARKKKIKRLLALMNKHNLRFIPVAPPLVEMMDLVIEDEELDYLLKMGTQTHDLDQAMALCTMPADRFQAFFDRLQRKGYVHIERDRDGHPAYRLAAIAVGWYETMMHYNVGKPYEKEFSERWNAFFQFFQKFNVFPIRNIQNIVMPKILTPAQDAALMQPETRGRKEKINLPVNTQLTHDTKIYPSFRVDDLVDEYGKKDSIYIFPCVCRHGNQLIGSACDFDIPKESCMAFGTMAAAWASWGYGRYISSEEARDILSEVREKGAIHSVIHEKEDSQLPVQAICNCCWDCCGILKPFNMGAIAIMYNASFSAQVKDDADCKTCSNCVKYCPTTAMRMEGKARQFNPNLCIGCGQCALQCPRNNIEMFPDERSVYLPLLKKSEARVSA